MRRQNRQYYWLKTQKKYRNLQKRLSSSTDEGLSKKLQGKLDRLGNRILSLNKKWRLGVATSILMAWMSAGTAQAQFTNPYDLSGLDGTNGFTINGISVNDQSGRAVSAAGDFNGDGINDLLIGAYGVNSYTGAAYVVFGSSGGFPSALELSTLNGSNGVIIEGENLGDETGKAISEAGDVNGDGIDDIIVSAVRADPGGRSGAGKIYVIFGSNSAIPATINVGTLDGNNGFVVNGITAGDEAGHSVAGGWDVNNDGISDMIVSSFKANSDTGEAYVVFGQSTPFASSLELSALDGNNGFTMQGIDPTDYLGHAVDLIEDFNNDGFNDIIISAPAGDGPANGVSGSGETYVVFGKATPFGSTLDLSTLDGNNGFTIYGVNVNDEAGYTVSGAGDINGDGFNDLLVGAPSATAPGYYGIVYVVFGSNLGFSASFDLNDMNGVNGFFINGENDYGGYAGFSVSAAGDINGDGVDDLLLGAIGGSANAYAGAGYVIFGKTTPFSTSMDLSSLNGSNGFKIPGLNDDDYSASVAGPGDINGDGIDDIFIGAAGGDPGGNSLAGESYVIFGIDISTPVVTKLTPADDATDVAPNLPLVISFDEDIQIGIGNITIRRSSDDGIIEVIDVTSAQANVGGSPVIPPYNLVIEPSSDLPNNENLYIEIDAGAILDLSANPFAGISGPTSWNFTTAPPIDPGAYLFSNLLGSDGIAINGIDAYDESGQYVYEAGDINNDGFQDFAINATETAGYNGEMYIVFGSSTLSGPIELSALDGNDGFLISGIDPNDQLISAASAGDINGDNISDLILGADLADPGGRIDAGEAYVIFGKSTPWAASFDLSTLDGTTGFVLNGIDAGDQAGYGVAGIGDINNDNIDDVVLSALNADPNGLGSGESYVVFGKLTPFAAALELSTLDGTNGFKLNGSITEESLGYSASGLGDINGDGIDDFILGASPQSNLYDWETGRAYVIFGKSSPFSATVEVFSLNGTDGFKIDNIEASYTTISVVSSAGDFNGDGFKDILIGDPGANFAVGRAFVVFGKNTGFPASLNLSSLDGSNGHIINGIGYYAGYSASGIGDFNGDGFDDIAIGAPYDENIVATQYAGNTYVVFGSNALSDLYIPISGIDGTNGLIFQGYDYYDAVGASVSGVGDVNGDGLADILVGAPKGDPGGRSDAGESYIIFGQPAIADVTAPLLSTFTPADETTGVALATNLTMTFNESVQKGTGNLVIFDASDDSIVETIDVTSANVTTAGNTATINPVNDLPGGTTFYIQVAGTAFEDFSGNPFAGIADQTSWNFTTFLDVAVPLISTLSPVDESIDVLLDTDLSITFDEPIQKGIGNVTIFSSSDQSIVEAIDVTTANVVIAGNSATISPTNDLPANQRFYVQVDATAFEDLSSNAFLGITDTITWNFNSVVILNATPTVVLNGAGITSYSENAGSVTLAVDITITDDTPLMEGATITISGNFQTGEDELGFTDANGIAGVFDAATGILTLTGSAAPADYAAALATVRYRNTSENPSVLDRTIDYQVSDGFNFSTAISTTLSVSGVNDPPVLVSSGSPINYRSLTGEIIVDNTVTVTDVDHSSLVGAVASISSNFSSGEDVLHFVDQNGITGSFNAVSGVLTLAGSATLADYQLALRSITYENTINAPSAPTKAIDFQVSDPNDVSNVPTQTINVADNVVIADTFSEVVAVGDSIGWDILARAQFNPADNITISIVSAPALAEFEVIGSLFSYKPFIDVDGADEIVYELCNEFASCSTGTISLDVQNADPIINQEEPDRIAPKEDASILLTDYISDANGNLDLSTLEIISQPNKSNAFAEIDDQYFLKVDYSTTNFTGADRVTVGVCDLSGACIEEVIVIIVGELDMVNVFNAVSPNGDGLHDYLNIQDLEYFTSNAVFIYNRLGQLVYTMEAYENEIPGMRFEGFSDSGEDLPNGTYYWYVQMTSAEGKDYKQSGFFVLSK